MEKRVEERTKEYERRKAQTQVITISNFSAIVTEDLPFFGYLAEHKGEMQKIRLEIPDFVSLHKDLECVIVIYNPHSPGRIERVTKVTGELTELGTFQVISGMRIEFSLRSEAQDDLVLNNVWIRGTFRAEMT